MRTVRGFPPLAADHPLIKSGRQCGVCGKVFEAGDITSLVPVPGKGMNRPAIPIHASCAEAEEDGN